MMPNIGRLLILLVVGLLVTETVSDSYTSNIGGNVLTSPGFSTQLTKAAAQAWCMNNGSQLLEIKSRSTQDLTVQFLSNTGFQSANGVLLFTNGMRTDGNWNWVNGMGINSIIIIGQGQDITNSFGYINFSPSPPRIVASISTETRGYICQGKFDCTNGVMLNGLCYKSYSSPTMSWFDARNKCLNDGGDISSFDFIKDDNGLNSTLNASWLTSAGTYWIGVRRQWWTWQTSNLEANYTNWMNGRPVYIPGTRCLCLYNSGGTWNWIECDCNMVYPFVCLTEPPSTSSTSASSTRVTTTSSAERTTASSSGFGNSAATNSNPSTVIALGNTNDIEKKLGIGLGVGIGGALIIAAIIIAVCLVIRKHGRPRCLRKSPVSNPPDVILRPVESHYADIPKQPGYDNSSMADANQFSTTAVYSQLEILTGNSSPTHDKDSISLLSSRTATLAPPLTHKGITHLTVNGEQYAEVMK